MNKLVLRRVLLYTLGMALVVVTTVSWLRKGHSPSTSLLSDQPAAPSPSLLVSENAEATILRAIAPMVVVYLGENHDNPADHRAQLSIIEALDQRREIAIALEMFQRPSQPLLDRYLSGEISEAQLRAQSDYDNRWGYDWELYAPILRYAKAHQIPLIALNTPTEVTRKVAESGLGSLSGEDLEHIPPVAEIDLQNQAHRDWAAAVFNAHGGHGNSDGFENFYAAQVLWDETMAERIAQHLRQTPNRQVIVLTGEGHIAYGYGIPSRVARRIPDINQATLQLIGPGETAEPGLADYLWVTD